MTTVFLNGRFYGGPDLPLLADARVSAFDAGIQHAVGLFETMSAGCRVEGVEGSTSHGESVEAWVLHLDRHMERLAASAKELGLSDSLRVAPLQDAVLETVKRSRLPRARVRVTITAGDLSLLNSKPASGTQSSAPDPTLLIVAQPATLYPDAMFERGVSLALAQSRANPLNPTEGHKTLNYWWRLRELQVAAAKGAGESLVLSITNHLCSGCVSNVFLVKDEQLLTPLARGESPSVAPTPAQSANPITPALHHPVLPGVARACIIERAERWGMRVHKRMLSVQDVLDADEVFLTNSSWGVLPVVALEGSTIADGKVGRFTHDFRHWWLDLFPAEEAGADS